MPLLLLLLLLMMTFLLPLLQFLMLLFGNTNGLCDVNATVVLLPCICTWKAK
jgi:hypothetical protein